METVGVDKAEARDVALALLAPLRLQPYDELVALVAAEPQTDTVVAPSGKRYEVEAEVFWDDRPGGAVRVAASVFDDSWRATFLPLSEFFIKAPDGSFVDE